MSALRLMFTVFSQRLTAWATTFMLDTYSKLHVLYDVGRDCRGGIFRRTVTNIRTGDKFFVTSDFRCTLDPDSPIYGGKKCWQQVYSGVLCIHGLLACADRVNRTKEMYEKVKICYAAMKACHGQWYRANYGAVEGGEFRLTDPSGLSRAVVANREASVPSDPAHAVLAAHFKNLLSICSRASVVNCLRDLQVQAMQTILLTRLQSDVTNTSQFVVSPGGALSAVGTSTSSHRNNSRTSCAGRRAGTSTSTSSHREGLHFDFATSSRQCNNSGTSSAGNDAGNDAGTSTSSHRAGLHFDFATSSRQCNNSGTSSAGNDAGTSTSSHREGLHFDFNSGRFQMDFTKPLHLQLTVTHDAPRSSASAVQAPDGTPLSASSMQTQLFQCGTGSSQNTPLSGAIRSSSSKPTWVGGVSPKRGSGAPSDAWIVARRQLFDSPSASPSSDTSESSPSPSSRRTPKINTPSSANRLSSSSSSLVTVEQARCTPFSPSIRSTPKIDTPSSANPLSSSSSSLVTVEQARHIHFTNPPRRHKRTGVNHEVKQVSKPRRKKRRPNKGSTDETNNEMCAIRRKSGRKSRQVDHKRTHDVAISRVVGPDSCPAYGDFSAAEMKSIVTYLGLTPDPDTNNKVTRSTRVGRHHV